MTNFDNSGFPSHLAGRLQAHSQVQERLEIGKNDLTNEEITKLKKQKLKLRTEILQTSYRTDCGPRISEAVLHPLSVDTLLILERRLKDEFDYTKTQVGPSSPDFKKLEDLLRRVTGRLGTKSAFCQTLCVVEAA